MTHHVEVASFFDPEEAWCARGYLSAQGIDTIIENEHHLTTAPWLRIALGGYRLMALPDAADDAKAALGEIAIAEPAIDEPYKSRKNWAWLPVAFLSSTPFIPIYKNAWELIGQLLLIAGFYALIAQSLYYLFWVLPNG